MGLLNFLNKRPSADSTFDSIAHQGPSMAAPARPDGQGKFGAHGINSRASEERPPSSRSRSKTIADLSTSGSSLAVKPRLVKISEDQAIDCRDREESKSLPRLPKSSRRNVRDAARGLTLNTGLASAGDKMMSPLKSDGATPGQSRRPSTFVDLLDASGEFRTYDFRSRVHASGAREYGEDVAERNMAKSIASPVKAAAPAPARPCHRNSDAQSLHSQLPAKEDLHSRKSSLAASLQQQRISVAREEDDQPLASMARGSVRAAREALRANGQAGVRPGRSESPTRLLPHQKPENYYDWSRFNKSTWDDASSAHSEGPGASTSHCSRRHGSVASSVPPLCEPYSPRTSGSRSIRTVESSSIDLSHASFFRDMKFNASSRSLRSRGGDSSIAPDEDSCGDSVFISPATPVKDISLSLLAGRRTKGGLAGAGFEPTAIYDSDTESFREKRGMLRPDGEAFVSKDDKDLDAFFDDANGHDVSASKWAELPFSPVDIYELGDEQRSMLRHRAARRPNTKKPFTQRERMLALGYDYDSDSDVEATVDSDEMPEERALKLLNSLIGAGRSQPGPEDERAANMKVNMNTVAKLRREIRKRRRTGAAGGRVGRAPSTFDHQDDESRDETI